MSETISVDVGRGTYTVKNVISRDKIKEYFDITLNGKPFENLDFLLTKPWVSQKSLLISLEETFLGKQSKAILELPGCDECYEFKRKE